MSDLAKRALCVTKHVRAEVPSTLAAPERGERPLSEGVQPFSVVRKAKGYIRSVVNQANGTYEHGWYDACAVMVRRLLETLIIEVYEHYGMSDSIKDSQGVYLGLGELVPIFLAETNWSVGRQTKAALPKMKELGDLSAHSRRYNAHRQDISSHIDELRIAVQELVSLAGQDQ